MQGLLIPNAGYQPSLRRTRCLRLESNTSPLAQALVLVLASILRVDFFVRVPTMTSYLSQFADLWNEIFVIDTALVRLICSFRIVASESEPPNTDYVEYNQFKSALVAIPRDFKVKLIPRDRETTLKCARAAEKRTEDSYVG